jgi:hypothetical protein
VIADVFLNWSLTLSAAGAVMQNLALEYSALGRFQEAAVMGEKTLMFQRRVLPENHPGIGATRLCMFV